ncbi:hypothetical protein CP10139811_0421 [Chlamydia ibidis]|uniref:Uncharacterized protein n=2 Tax=Chlamydia ibidis TaxID=1405396 RepID=S7KF44_9CHLA|nr:hypothetical protein CP10139811_0421 [Chlamydia ibidis]EQM62353.1 hypothetical protein H359_0798 [Chlamydia ibidis 10-1398/6]
MTILYKARFRRIIEYLEIINPNFPKHKLEQFSPDHNKPY